MKRVFKKGIAFLLAMLCALNLTVVSFAEDTVTSGTCGTSAQWSYDEANGKLTISGTGKIEDSYKGWSEIKANVKTVEIADGITVIGRSAFNSFTALESVTLGSGIREIGDSAFAWCDALNDVFYNGGITDWCSIDVYYNPMQSGKNLYLDGKLVEGDIVIPEGVTEIPTGAFSNCSKITSVRLPDGLQEISYDAFRYCSSMTNINFPNGITKIGTTAFGDCIGLTDIIVPGTAERIDTGAFRGCTSLKTVEISDGLVRTGSNMFENCTSLTSVILPETLTHVSGSTFKGCTALETVELPDSVTNINASAFNSCTALRNLKLSKNLVQIAKQAFQSCDSLESVMIPESVTAINDLAFSSCDNLATVVLPENLIELGINVFGHCKKLTSIDIPDKITAIPEKLFFYCEALENIEIPESVTSVGKSAFSGCKNLKNVILPDGLTTIDTQAFVGCKGLTEFTVPESVTSIGERAFSNCLYLTTTYYTGTEEQWSEIAIASGNDALTRNVVFNYGKPTNMCGENATWTFDEASGTLTISGTGAVSDYSGWKDIASAVTYVEIGDGITSVGENAFNGFTVLKEVYLAESVTELGADAFKDCSKLATVTTLSDALSFGNAFSGNDSRLFFVAKAGSGTYTALKSAGFTVNGISTDKEKDGYKVLSFDGKTTIYRNLDYNYISNLITENSDTYYLYFDKITFDGIAPDIIIVDEENLDNAEEYFTLNEVYISVSVNGKTVSLPELVELLQSEDVDGIISFEQKEEPAIFEQIYDLLENVFDNFITEANRVIISVINAIKRLFRR